MEKLEKLTDQQIESLENTNHKTSFNTIKYWTNQPLNRAKIIINKQSKKLKKIKSNTLKNSIKRARNSLKTNSKSNAKMNTSSLNCWYTNATSLNNKFDDFTAQIDIHKPHAIFVTETWWDETSTKNVEGYTLFFRDRDGRGGGVALYVLTELYPISVNIDQLNSKTIEQIWCFVNIGKESIILGNIYRPGNVSKSINKEIIESIKSAHSLITKKVCTGICLCGDYNYSNINWSDEGFGSWIEGTENSAGAFLECLENLNLKQNVVEPTFQIDLGKNSNVLDLILTENENRIFKLEHLPPLGAKTHAHHVLKFSYSTEGSESPKKVEKMRFNYKKGNYVEISD